MTLFDWYMAFRLWLSIVFRKAVPWAARRITPREAWQVATIVWVDP